MLGMHEPADRRTPNPAAAVKNFLEWPEVKNSQKPCMIITKILLEKGLWTPAQLNEAMALQQAEGLRLDRAIIQLGFLSERQLLELMAKELRLPFVNLEEVTIDAETLRALPPKIL